MFQILTKPTKYNLASTDGVHDPFGGHLGYGIAAGDLDIPKALTHERQIDPIHDPGELDVQKAVSASSVDQLDMPFAHQASLILSDGDYFKNNILRQDISTAEKEAICERSWKTKTKLMFAASVTILIGWTLFEICRRDEITAYSKFFQVPKGTNFWRVIADSRIAGRLCRSPDPVNFPHVRTLLLEIAALGATFAVVGDFKFWFYQMEISTELRRFFGIECGEIFCRLRCLPQGWSWSPRIAQSMSWLIILYHEKNEDTLGVHEEWSGDPPPFVRLKDPRTKNVVGLIFLWLDNIFVIHKDPKIRDLWFKRLERNGKVFNARWKQLDITDSPKYLGIHFNIKAPENSDSFVQWAHDKDRIGKWKTILDKPIMTARDMAAHVGIIIWHHMVSLEPLYSAKRCINVLRRIAPKLKFKSWWDKPLADIDPELAVTPEESALLKRHVSKAYFNAPSSIKIPSTSITMYGCTDACKVDQFDLSGPNARKRTGMYINGAGYVIYGSDFERNPSDFRADKKRWTDAERKLDIHLLELMAIEWAVSFVPPLVGGIRLILGVDNTVAISALNNGYSTSDEACSLALKIRKECLARGIVLELMWVPTKENASDPLSRGLEADTMLNEATWKILHGMPPKTKQHGRRTLDAKKVEDILMGTSASIEGEIVDDLDEEDDSYEAKLLAEFS